MTAGTCGSQVAIGVTICSTLTYEQSSVLNDHIDPSEFLRTETVIRSAWVASTSTRWGAVGACEWQNSNKVGFFLFCCAFLLTRVG